MEKLPYGFYNRHAVEVARSLLGKKLVWDHFEGIITETEAYRGSDDLASHASRGLTPRSAPMFGPPGHLYIYLIYGLYHCLNIVAEEPGSPGAVLIRGVQSATTYLNGPGKICRHLGIDRSHNALSIISHQQRYLTQGINVEEYQATPRIGIQKEKYRLWRFLLLSGK